MPGKLVICPTPIGNLQDMPPRALAALRDADVICAEDTRVTGKLLAALGVEDKRLERLDENVLGARAREIAQRVIEGEIIAYCTDAGMPGVSDPGLRLVRVARETGAQIEVLPGPTAVATAYVASGSTSSSFFFGGFFPRKDAARHAVLQQLKHLGTALVFYESPNRILQTLQVLAKEMPHRTVSVCRELTKLHEEVLQGSAQEVHDQLATRPSIQGEIVFVVDAPPLEEEQEALQNRQESAQVKARNLLAEGLRPKEVAKQLAAEFDLPRNAAYEIALEARQAE